MNVALQSTITLLQNNSLTSVVQQEIERAILVGEYEPGSKLIEATLAGKMGVSRGPVREAFRMLEEAGLVRNEKNRGVFVRDIPIDEALEIFELRAVMDQWVGRQLAKNISPEQLRELEVLLDAMELSVKSQDARGYHLQNLYFHDQLVDMAGNRKLTEIYRKLIKELSLFRRLNLAAGWLMPLSANEHRQIVMSIASGDADAAGRAMFNHVMQSKQRTIENDVGRRAPLARQAQKQEQEQEQEHQPTGRRVLKTAAKSGEKTAPQTTGEVINKLASQPNKESPQRDKR